MDVVAAMPRVHTHKSVAVLDIGQKRFARVSGVGVTLSDPAFAGGFYVEGRCVIFATPEGLDRVCLVNNDHTRRANPFFVSCSRMGDGHRRYLHACSDLDSWWLGVGGMSYRNEILLATRISAALGLIPTRL